jgi:hypothetical protein
VYSHGSITPVVIVVAIDPATLGLMRRNVGVVKGVYRFITIM